jgi:Mycobacterial cell wall arabinan synthesis protein/Arabinosyltransferase concanavalin like domain
VVSLAAPVLTADPDRPPPPRPDRAALLVGVLAAVATLCALAFPFAPVTQPDVRYSWTAAAGSAAIPLMPYQPVALTATTTCDAVRATPPGAAVLATVPSRPDPTAYPLDGLRLVARPDGLAVTTAGVGLGTARLPAGRCTITLTSDPRGTSLAVDGATVLTRDGDVRPDVAGAFSAVPGPPDATGPTDPGAQAGPGRNADPAGPAGAAAGPPDARAGTGLTLTADTRFQTTITPLKAAFAIVGVAALLVLLVLLARTDARHGRRVRLLPRRWWRPTLPDLTVTGVLVLWWIVGAPTVDDGYIAGIVRSRGENGFTGNVYRWLNAPEAPFSWFYDLLHLWSQISPSTVWMRLPSVLLGLLCWALLSRGLLPRVVRVPASWLAALAFLTWWVPLDVGLRPEPWVAAGLLGVTLAVERAVVTRRLLPIAVGLVLAGATTALTPGGLIAFTPFLAALLPVLRLLRARRDLHPRALVVALVACVAPAAFLMVDDQSLAGMLEAVRVRGIVGGGLPWYGEYERYANLLDPAGFQGSIGRRAAVLTTLLAGLPSGCCWRWRS